MRLPIQAVAILRPTTIDHIEGMVRPQNFLCDLACDAAATAAAAACTAATAGVGLAACLAAAETAHQFCRSRC
jgi:hypothetical protein